MGTCSRQGCTALVIGVLYYNPEKTWKRDSPRESKRERKRGEKEVCGGGVGRRKGEEGAI